MAKSRVHEFAAAGDLDGILGELSSGVNINARDPANDQTPLMTAVAHRRADGDFVRALLQRGAEVNLFASDHTLSENMQRMEELDALLQSGGDSPTAAPRFDDLLGIFAKTKEMFGSFGDREITSENALSIALKIGNPDVIVALLEGGADVKYMRPYGYGALIDASHGPESVIQMLIDRGAPLNTVSDFSESALRIASRLGRFSVVRRLLAAGADPRPLEWTPLMHAVALGTVQDVTRELQGGADLLARDTWERTPFLLSVAAGDVVKAEMLLNAGSSRLDRGRCGKQAVAYPFEHDDAEMLHWLIREGFDVEGLDEFGHTPLREACEACATQCVAVLLDAGADVRRGKDAYERPMRNAGNIAIVRLLVDRGADLNEISDEMRAELTGQQIDGPIHATAMEFATAHARRFGIANPQTMNNAFWNAMVSSGAIAYSAREKFAEARRLEEPIWCFRRFGKSINELPDGRIIEIGGEHEDHYDEDFCIYNDVIVHRGIGAFDIYGYPREIFPPTDFHTATLIGKYIYVIGSAGYGGERRHGDTPVYRLDTTTLEFQTIPTTGEKPGWLCRHKAELVGELKIRITGGNVYAIDDQKETYADNTAAFVLDLPTLSWRKEG